MLYLGSDHGGFEIKSRLSLWLSQKHIPFSDLGPHAFVASDDYPDYAQVVSYAVQKDPVVHRGILLCRSGIGMSIVANKFRGIRAGLCCTVAMARLSRLHDHTNILVLASDHTSYATLEKIVAVWLKTRLSTAKRHVRRIHKITNIEQQCIKSSLPF